MKVRLVYIVAFNDGDEGQQKETKNCADALTRKYQSRGVEVRMNRITTGSSNPAFLTMQKNICKAPSPKSIGYAEFTPFMVTDSVDYSSPQGSHFGVGLYFIFHGRVGSADINLGPVLRITSWLMNKHPNGQLRKVVFLVCGYAGSSRGGRSLLTKFATHLKDQNPSSRQHLPKLAAWCDYITVDRSGAKLVNEPGNRSTYLPAKKLPQAKCIYVLENGEYVQRWLHGPNDEHWHDP